MNEAAHIDPHGRIAAASSGIFHSDRSAVRTLERPKSSFLKSIVGRHTGLRSVLDRVRAVAPTNATVLLTGETGTGKELIARAIHELSPRRARNLVNVNCTTMPAGLLESELFGHQRGAFTGAIHSHAGRFALADGGTLFLDEIGDLPLELQPKLLRVLQEQEFEPLGSTGTIRVDVRVIAASNRDLREMVYDQEFRKDLYYRLNIFPIALPPLRERKEDIPDLVRHYIDHFASSMNKTIDTVPEGIFQLLSRYPWPGNIRELQNYVARSVILSSDGVFEPAALEPCEPVGAVVPSPNLKDIIRREILIACLRANWKIGGARGAAAQLGMNRTTLLFKMKRLGITRPAESCQECSS